MPLTGKTPPAPTSRSLPASHGPGSRSTLNLNLKLWQAQPPAGGQRSRVLRRLARQVPAARRIQRPLRVGAGPVMPGIIRVSAGRPRSEPFGKTASSEANSNTGTTKIACNHRIWRGRRGGQLGRGPSSGRTRAAGTARPPPGRLRRLCDVRGVKVAKIRWRQLPTCHPLVRSEP